MSRNWIIAGVAAVCFITGVTLSHVIEPGVRVEKNFHFSNSGVINITTVVFFWGEHPIVLFPKFFYAAWLSKSRRRSPGVLELDGSRRGNIAT